MTRPDLSVVVPAYEEENRIGNLGKILEFLRGRPYAWELLVVEDGSRDQTRELALRELAGEERARLISYPVNRGKGFSVRGGVLASRGRWVLFMDLDLAVPLSYVDKALAELDSGWDAVVGSRAAAGAKTVRAQPFWRRAGARAFHALRGVLLPSPVRDSQCGFKAFKGDAAREAFSACTVDGFMFDVELLKVLEGQGRRILEMPVEWSDGAGSKFSVRRHFLGILRDLWAIRFRGGR